jgi:hypothetical protein
MPSEPAAKGMRRVVLGTAPGAAFVLGVVTTLAGCATQVPNSAVTTSPALSATAAPTSIRTAETTPTAEPSVAILFEQCGPAPPSLAADAFVMATDWGPIYCGVPADFPVWPRGEVYEAVDDPDSALWLATGTRGLSPRGTG